MKCHLGNQFLKLQNSQSLIKVFNWFPNYAILLNFWDQKSTCSFCSVNQRSFTRKRWWDRWLVVSIFAGHLWLLFLYMNTSTHKLLSGVLWFCATSNIQMIINWFISILKFSRLKEKLVAIRPTLSGAVLWSISVGHKLRLLKLFEQLSSHFKRHFLRKQSYLDLVLTSCKYSRTSSGPVKSPKAECQLSPIWKKNPTFENN